jgi:hypothetical protein
VIKYLDELPEPLVTYELFEHFINATKEDDLILSIQEVIKSLPHVNLKILQFIIRYLIFLCKNTQSNMVSILSIMKGKQK